MPEELTPAEVRCHAGALGFTAAFVGDEGGGGSGNGTPPLVASWVQARGRVEKGSGDSGRDLVMTPVGGGFPRVVLAGVAGLSSGAVFSPSGRHFAVQTSAALLLGETADPAGTGRWAELLPGEAFAGIPVWINEDRVLFGVRGGAPKRDRLFCSPRRSGGGGARTGPIFVAEHGGALLSWDHSQEEDEGRASVAVVHRLANAMLAEVVVIAGGRQTVVAADCRQEYCRPLAGFLAGGALLLRLNALVRGGGGGHLRDARAPRPRPPWDTPAAGGRHVHGLWLVEDPASASSRLRPVDVLPGSEHGTYDCCSGSYGRPGAAEGFRMDRGRRTVVVTARRTGGAGDVSYSDDLYRLRLGESGALLAAEPLGSEAVSGKGCKIPVAVGEDSVVYHHRSPTESGDLWVSAPGTPAGEARVTETMPLSLRCKLLVPREVTIANGDAPARPGEAPLPVHAQVFVPGGDGPLQPLLWLHGGPMAQYSFDCNTLLSWLAGCGYLVLAPNFSGSTGSGLEFMDRVLGEGCGVADLSDCLACAAYLESGEVAEMESRLDLSRGVAVGGHSWGGYLAYMCMLEKRPDGTSVFGCGVAAAGIADWFVQQRHTEVRYYDHALMGGWVYEGEVSLRARRASPMSRAADLRAPILVLHGEEDVDVPFRQIPPLVEAMRRSPHPGASVKYHAYKGEDHGMSGTEAQADYLDRVKTFLRINLKPWDFTDNPHGEVTAY